MKFKKIVKLFSFVSFLALSCCFIPKTFAAIYKGIDYTLSGPSLVINKDIEDENVRIEFAKKLREENPEIREVTTPLCRHTMEIIKPKAKTPGKKKDYVSFRWEAVKDPTTQQEREKIKDLVSFIIFDTVQDDPGCSVTYSRTGAPELYVTKSGGLGERKQLQEHSGSTFSRENKRLICELKISSRVVAFFKEITEIVGRSGLTFPKGFECYVAKTTVF